MKLKVQAQHLQPGDVLGGGETVAAIIVNSTMWSSSKVQVTLDRYYGASDEIKTRTAYWGKYTEINIERPERVET